MHLCEDLFMSITSLRASVTHILKSYKVIIVYTESHKVLMFCSDPIPNSNFNPKTTGVYILHFTLYTKILLVGKGFHTRDLGCCKSPSLLYWSVEKINFLHICFNSKSLGRNSMSQNFRKKKETGISLVKWNHLWNIISLLQSSVSFIWHLIWVLKRRKNKATEFVYKIWNLFVNSLFS